MKQTTERKKLTYYYIAAFLIPAVLMMIVYIILGTYPFGGRSILVADLRYQFLDYYEYFKSIILGDNDFFYTFSKSLGGDAIGFCAYYLQNPFNLILLFFSREMLPVGVLLMVILEAGFAGLIFNYFLNQMNKPHISSIIFSTAYAFIGMYVAYMNLTIYFFNIAIFPLVILGIHRIVINPKRKLTFIISLAISILSCYYMGYMACIFSVIYFVYELLCDVETIKRLKDYKEQLLSFILSSMLAVGLTAFDLIPTILSLAGEKISSSPVKFYISRKFIMLDLFSNLYSMAFDGNISNGRPLIYAGVMAFIFTLIYLLSRKINQKERILSSFLLLVMLGCFYIYAVDLVWHGLSEPVGFPYRYSFIFSFLLLYFGYRGFTIVREQGIEKKKIGIILGVYVLYSVYLLLSKRTAVGMSAILFNTTLLLLLIIVAFCYFQFQKSRKICLLALLMIQSVDLCANAVHSISMYPSCEEKEYAEYVEYAEEGVGVIQEQDHSFYRMEKNFRRTHNDAMSYGFNGLSHFSSTQKEATKEFLGKLGFRNNGNWAFYNDGSTTFADCFLGVKYLLSQFDAHGKPYPIIISGDQYWVFQNPYVLPLGFGITKDILNVDMQSTDTFEIQNKIADSFTSKDNAIYTKIQLNKMETENVSQEGNTYKKIDSNQEAYVEYLLEIDREDLVYLYFTAPDLQEADLIINERDNRGQYFSRYNWDVMDLGEYKPGDTVSVRLSLTGDSITIDQAYFYYENKEALINWFEQSKIDGWNPEKISSSHLKGTVTMTEDNPYLMFSIPYEKDWRVEIDGNRTEAFEVVDALMAVEIEPGEHFVEIKYIPRGLYIGVIISLISTFGTIVLIVLKNLKKH